MARQGLRRSFFLNHSSCVFVNICRSALQTLRKQLLLTDKYPQMRGCVSSNLLLRPAAAHAIDVQPYCCKCGITRRNGYKYEKAHFGCNGSFADHCPLLDQHRSQCCKHYPGCCQWNQGPQGQQSQSSRQSKKGLCQGSRQGKEAHCQEKDAGYLNSCCQKGRLYRPFAVKTNHSKLSKPCI